MFEVSSGARPRTFSRTGVGLTLVALVAAACGGVSQAPPEVLPSPSLTAATPSEATDEPTSIPAHPTVQPTLVGTLEPTEQPATATPTATPSEPPAQPTPAVLSAIAFGQSYTQTTNDVTLDDASDRFDAGTSVAWRVELPPAQGTETIIVQVIDANGAVVYDGIHTPDAGSSIYFGEAVLATSPGWYTMRYLLNDTVIGEGAFRIRAVATVTPEPDRTPKPTRKPNDNPPSTNCDPSYPTLCLRSSPDLDCGEINARRFPVRGRDPHGFDGDGDGIGCESD